MKIAACISGHMRTYRETAESLHENLLKPLSGGEEYDIFIHTCHENDMSSNCLKNPENSPLKPVQLNEEDLALIDKLYEPKKISFDLSTEKTGLGRQPMLRRIAACDNLRLQYEKENNKNYDLVIRLRPDTFFVEKFEPIALQDNEIIFFSYGRHHGGYYDGFAIGSGQVMERYSEMHMHSEKIRMKQEGNGHIKIEKVLKEYIDSLGYRAIFCDKASYTLRSWGQRYTFFDQDPVTCKFVQGKIHV